MIQHTLILILQNNAHIGHAGIDHIGDGKVHNAVAGRIGDRICHTLLHQRLQFRAFAVGKNDTMHPGHFLSTSL